MILLEFTQQNAPLKSFLLSQVSDEVLFLELTALAPCTIFSSIALIKLNMIWWNQKRLTRIVNKLEEIFPKTEDDQEEYHIRETRRESYMITIYFSVSYMILIWVFNLLPLIVSIMDYMDTGIYKRQLPYFIWYPFNPTKTAKMFMIMYVQQNWGAFVSMIGILGTDLFFGCFITQLSMQFKTLTHHLTFITTPRRAKGLRNARLKSAIERHHTLIDLCAEMEDIYNFSILCNFVLSSLMICLVGFQSTNPDVHFDILFKYVMFLICAMWQVFCLCYYGNVLLETSQALSWGAFCSQWHREDAEYQKSILMILMRAQRPQYVTAGKFSIVSLRSFTAILSTAFSYFTLLRSVYYDNGGGF
ncbi:putative odorant receptor 85d [Phlebotomus argentipes]|uniref:putative odorant receptor 85d n=1 Tax=Phlebotomus argentipes TaxID=94469 RepID=UPI0028936B97|nr:putative odorant receptor 85d [Phlebotomus argentipes]